MKSTKTQAQINGDKPASEMTKRELIAMHLATTKSIGLALAAERADYLLQTLEETKS